MHIYPQYIQRQHEKHEQHEKRQQQKQKFEMYSANQEKLWIMCFEQLNFFKASITPVFKEFEHVSVFVKLY